MTTQTLTELAAEQITTLSPEKRALLEQRMRHRDQLARAASDNVIPRRSGGSLAPVSFAQQRLWFLDQLDGNGTHYNGIRAFRLHGPLNAAALASALTKLAARHDILRTSFLTIDGQPHQSIDVISSPAYIPLVINSHDTPAAERDAQAERIAIEEASKPFDLTRAPLLRVTYTQFTDAQEARVSPKPMDGREATDGVLVFAVHHIIIDRWSDSILYRDLAALYQEALSTRPTSDLPDLPIQYADFSVWQRAWLQNDVLEDQLAYWRKQLGGTIPLLELTTDRPAPATLSGRGARVTMPLSRRLTDALEQLGKTERATLFMVLLAAVQTLLHRYTGQDDILVGSPVSGRNRPEIEPLIGFFVNTLVLRSDLSANPTFRELIARVRATALDAYDHQDIPFEKLVEELRPERRLNSTPFFRVMFALQNAPAQPFALSGLRMDPIDVDTGSAKFDLSFLIDHIPDGLSCAIEYSADLFDHDTIARMLGHLDTLLHGIVEAPDKRLCELPLLTPAERRQILVEWNPAKRPYPDDRCIHELFAAQAARTPSAIAVCLGAESLTYAMLNARANQLARHLRRAGVGAGVFVGICVERSIEMVVGILGILKAGGTYVPLDPNYPQERLAYMLGDTGAPVLLTQHRLIAMLPPHNATVIALDSDWPSIAQESAQEVAGDASPQAAAYVIYTSGSTGKPKGVLTPHRAVTNLVINTSYASLGPSDAFTQVSGFSFDVTTFEIWGTLLNGARLVIIPKEILLSPDDFAQAIARERITATDLTSAVFNQIARARPDAFASLTWLFVGGDVVDPACVKRVLQSGPPKNLFNAYGPTETTTTACAFAVKRVTEEMTSIPIGRPISNYEAYVLDHNRNPVPIGIPGELYIGGDGVALGYLNAPELTAAKFIAHPFSDNPDARLYKSGDLVRYLPDGNIDFIGRADNQVKIRGFRIELGEIEAALNHHPRIGQSCVIARGAESDRNEIANERSLVAYVVPRNNHVLTPSELRTYLGTTLPDYMVPSAFVSLEAFPLTPNGKLDHRALPAPEHSAASDTAYTPPTTPIQVQFVALWEELLGHSPIGIDESFFDLGGHSLLAIRMMDRITRMTGTALPIRLLFEHPTIHALTQALVTYDDAVVRTPYNAFCKDGSLPPLFLCHGYFTGGLYTINLSRHLGPQQPLYALHPHDPDGAPAELPPTIEAMAADRLREIRAVQPHGPYHLAGFCNGAYVAFEMAVQLQAQGEKVAFLGILTSQAPTRTHSRTLRKIAHRISWLLRLSHQQEIETYGRLLYRRELLRSPRKLCSRIIGRFTGANKQAEVEELADGTGVHAKLEITPGGYRFLDIMSAYKPYRFQGTLTLLWAQQAYRLPSDPTAGWSNLADSVDVHLMPGWSTTALTDHPDVVAKLLRESLEKACRPSASSDHYGKKECVRIIDA